jgi:hypothetical protein
MLELIKSLFTWLGEVLEDPNDKQGSTKRLCLLLFLTTVMSDYPDQVPGYSGIRT